MLDRDAFVVTAPVPPEPPQPEPAFVRFHREGCQLYDGDEYPHRACSCRLVEAVARLRATAPEPPQPSVLSEGEAVVDGRRYLVSREVMEVVATPGVLWNRCLVPAPARNGRPADPLTPTERADVDQWREFDPMTWEAPQPQDVDRLVAIIDDLVARLSSTEPVPGEGFDEEANRREWEGWHMTPDGPEPDGGWPAPLDWPAPPEGPETPAPTPTDRVKGLMQALSDSVEKAKAARDRHVASPPEGPETEEP